MLDAFCCELVGCDVAGAAPKIEGAGPAVEFAVLKSGALELADELLEEAAGWPSKRDFG